MEFDSDSGWITLKNYINLTISFGAYIMSSFKDLDLIIKTFSNWRGESPRVDPSYLIQLQSEIDRFDGELQNVPLEGIEVIYRFCQGITFITATLREGAGMHDLRFSPFMIWPSLDPRDNDIANFYDRRDPNALRVRIIEHINYVWKRVKSQTDESRLINSLEWSLSWGILIPDNFDELSSRLQFKFDSVPTKIIYGDTEISIQKCYEVAKSWKHHLQTRSKMRNLRDNNKIILGTLQSMKSDQEFIRYLLQCVYDSAPNKEAVLDQLLNHLSRPRM